MRGMEALFPAACWGRASTSDRALPRWSDAGRLVWSRRCRARPVVCAWGVATCSHTSPQGGACSISAISHIHVTRVHRILTATSLAFGFHMSPVLATAISSAPCRLARRVSSATSPAMQAAVSDADVTSPRRAVSRARLHGATLQAESQAESLLGSASPALGQFLLATRQR
jgi:hypothetical protein